MGYNKFITKDNTTLLDLTGDDLTNDTSKVLNGYKYHGRDGVQYTGTGTGGGTQPTLFAPVVTGGVNEISWANNTSNGDFAVTITADVNGTPVTSPLTITEQMDGQTLTITASATNFTSASTIVPLSYITQSPLFAAFGENTTNLGFGLSLTSGHVGLWDGTTETSTGAMLACTSHGLTPVTSNEYFKITSQDTDVNLEIRKVFNGYYQEFICIGSPFSANENASQIAVTLTNVDTQQEYYYSLTSTQTSTYQSIPTGIYTIVANITM